MKTDEEVEVVSIAKLKGEEE
jgi:hypothetical protein